MVDTTRLQQMLDRYVGALPYFYNVVVWLDRIVYSPEPLRALFLQELQSKIQEGAMD